MTWLSTNPSNPYRQLIVFVWLPMGTNTQTGHEGSQHKTKYQSAPCCLVAVQHINHSHSMFWRWESPAPFKSNGGDTSVVLISVSRQSCPSPQTGSASHQDPLSDSSSRLLQRNTTHLLVYVCVCLCLRVCCVLTVGSGQQQCRDEDDERGSHCVSDEDLQPVILLPDQQLLTHKRTERHANGQTCKRIDRCWLHFIYLFFFGPLPGV